MELTFVYCGYDFMLDCARQMLSRGHRLSSVWTFPCDNRFNFNQQTHALAAEAGVPVYEDAPDRMRVDTSVAQGTNFFLVAGYPYKIPELPPPPKVWGVNIHPSLLPKGRGLMPAPYILTGHGEAAGWTIHKLSPRLDEGDILAQDTLKLLPQECVETYSARTAMASTGALLDLLERWPQAWENAAPQQPSHATYFPPPDAAMRTIQWDMKAGAINAVARAFGRYGCLATLQGRTLAIYALDAWAERHDHPPGAVVFAQGNTAVIACADGFVCIKEYEAS